MIVNRVEGLQVRHVLGDQRCAVASLANPVEYMPRTGPYQIEVNVAYENDEPAMVEGFKQFLQQPDARFCLIHLDDHSKPRLLRESDGHYWGLS